MHLFRWCCMNSVSPNREKTRRVHLLLYWLGKRLAGTLGLKWSVMYREGRQEGGPSLTQNTCIGFQDKSQNCCCPFLYLVLLLFCVTSWSHPVAVNIKEQRRNNRLNPQVLMSLCLVVGSSFCACFRSPYRATFQVSHFGRESPEWGPSYSYFCTINKAISNRIWDSWCPCTADRHVMPVLQGTSLKSLLWLPQLGHIWSRECKEFAGWASSSVLFCNRLLSVTASKKRKKENPRQAPFQK